MPVKFVCSQCRRTLSVGQRKAGATVACPKCGTPNVVPRPEPAAAISGGATSPSADAAIAAPEPPSVASPAVPEAVVFDDIPELIAMIDSMPAAPPMPRVPFGSVVGANPSVPKPDPSPEAAPAPSAAAAAPEMAVLMAAAEPAPASIVASPPPIIGPVAAPPATAASIDLQVALRAVPPLPTAARAARPRRGHRDDSMLLISRKTIYAQAALMAIVALAALVAGYLIGRGARRESGSSTSAVWESRLGAYRSN